MWICFKNLTVIFLIINSGARYLGNSKDCEKLREAGKYENIQCILPYMEIPNSRGITGWKPVLK